MLTQEEYVQRVLELQRQGWSIKVKFRVWLSCRPMSDK